MKILLDNIVFGLQKAGGISAIWEKHINYLAKNSYVFKCIESPADNKNIFRKRLAIDKLVIPDRKLPLLIRRFLGVPTYGFDIFHSSYYRTSLKKIRSVVTIHDLMYEKFSAYHKKLVHTRLKMRALKESDAIICVSENTKKDLLKFYPWVKNKPIFIVYNGVDRDFYKLAELPEKINIGDESIHAKSFFLYIGSRGYCKNFPTVLDAASSEYAKDHHLKLVVVGGGPFSPLELTLIQKKNLKSRIIKLDNISPCKLNQLYNGAKALLFPSLYEGFGIPALEACRAKCLVISSNTSAIPEVVGGTPFAFNPSNPEEILEKLQLLDDVNLVQKAIDDAYLHSLNFSWDSTSEKTIDVYKYVLGNNG